MEIRKKVFVFFDQRTQDYVVTTAKPTEKRGTVVCGMTGAKLDATLYLSSPQDVVLGKFERNNSSKFNDVRLLQTMLIEVDIEERYSPLHSDCVYAERVEDNSYKLFDLSTYVRNVEWDKKMEEYIIVKYPHISYLGTATLTK